MVSKHIKDLLFDCDELIINDLGTLHAAYASADAHPASHVFAPPHKNITFSQNPKVSNGILEEYIAQTEGVSLQDAEGQVKQFVSSVKIDLGIHKKYPMAQLGSFVLQYEDQLEFKPETELNYLNDAYGLPQIFGKVVERTEDEIKAESAALTALATAKTGAKGATKVNNLNANNTNIATGTTTTKKPSEIDKENKKTNWGIIGAISSLGVISAIALYVLVIDPSKNPFRTILTDDKLAQKDKDKNTETKETTSEDKKVEENKPAEDKKIEENKPADDKKTEENKPAEDKKEEVKVVPPVENTNTNSEIVESKQGRFYVVIGGFGVQGNAYNMLNKLKGQGETGVKIIAPYGNSKLFRVAINSFASDADAKAGLAAIKNKYAEYQTAFVLAY